jgi:AAA family ATPase
VQKRGPRVRPAKTRVTVESVEPTPDVNKPLYFDPTSSKVSIKGITTDSASKVPTGDKESVPDEIFQISSDGIGGLSDHIATINESLAFLTSSQFTLQDQHLIGPTAFLIHGPEGTGKSMLLERLAQCAWQETFTLDSTSTSKAPAKELTETFEQARESQPSLILMDDVDKFLGKAETLVTRLRSELKKLEGTKVVVAATTRSLYDIDASLRTTSGYKHELEIFPPNVRQREDILRQIIGPNRSIGDVDFHALAERTHGFVGRDLHKLCGLARNRRVQSIYQSLKAEEKASFGEAIKAQDFVGQSDFDAVVDQVQPTVLKDSILEVPKVRWTDIAGLGHVQELLEAIMIRPFKVRGSIFKQ